MPWYPMGQAASAGQILDNYSCQMSLNRLSPYYLYSEAVSTIMNPMVRSTNIILPQQLVGRHQRISVTGTELPAGMAPSDRPAGG